MTTWSAIHTSSTRHSLEGLQTKVGDIARSEGPSGCEVWIHRAELLTRWCLSSWNLCHEHEHCRLSAAWQSIRKLCWILFLLIFYFLFFIFHHCCFITFSLCISTRYTICAAQQGTATGMNRLSSSHPLVPTSQRMILESLTICSVNKINIIHYLGMIVWSSAPIPHCLIHLVVHIIYHIIL